MEQRNKKGKNSLTGKPIFYFDSQICTGCKTCIIACRDKHDLEESIRWRRVVEYAGGNWQCFPDGTFQQDVFAYYTSISCNHCEQPICVEVCPTTAMNRDANGIVSVDHDKCMGCGYCAWACPYSAPQFQKSKGQMSKCDFCRSELENGYKPACVTSCPTHALNFILVDSTSEPIDDKMSMAPFPEYHLTKPNTHVKAHRSSQPSNSHIGNIANPEEIKDV